MTRHIRNLPSEESTSFRRNALNLERAPLASATVSLLFLTSNQNRIVPLFKLMGYPEGSLRLLRDNRRRRGNQSLAVPQPWADP